LATHPYTAQKRDLRNYLALGRALRRRVVTTGAHAASASKGLLYNIGSMLSVRFELLNGGITVTSWPSRTTNREAFLHMHMRTNTHAASNMVGEHEGLQQLAPVGLVKLIDPICG
jgi:hypothetical protein